MSKQVTVDMSQLSDLVGQGYSGIEIAEILGVSQATITRRKKDLRVGNFKVIENDNDIEIEEIEEEERSIDEILAARKDEYLRKKRSTPSLVNIKVNLDGPIGVAHFGDPHIDNPGTDISRIEEDLNIVKKTKGLFGANVGDTTDNWIGRLARLYENQTITKMESWKLAEWFVGKIQWLYLLSGNHDVWHGNQDPLYWIARQTGNVTHKHGVRLNLIFPNKKTIRINARHDFKGHSQWNPAHGPMKAIQMGWRDHILTCGHTHQAGIGVLAHPDQSQRIISYAIRVPSYKIYDSFAHEIGAAGNFVSACCTTIINPYADREEGLVTPIWDLEQSADYLTFLRKKYKV